MADPKPPGARRVKFWTGPPAVIIHGLDHVRAATGLAHPVTLLSAPGAARYAGAGWWRALADAGLASGVLCPDILDCGTAPGRALEALRAGCTRIVLQARPDVFDQLGERAERAGAMLFHTAPPALDLADQGAARRLAGWLANGGREGVETAVSGAKE